MEEHSMTLIAFLFLLFFVVLIVWGTRVHMYLYTRGVFHEGKIRQRRKSSLRVASFSQTATLHASARTSDLYYGGIGVRNEDRASIHVRRFMLFTLAILITLVVVAVLALGATQF